MSLRGWTYTGVMVIVAEVLVAMAQAQAHDKLPEVDLFWVTLAFLPFGALIVYATVVRQHCYRQRQVIEANASTAHDWVWESDAKDRITYSNDAVVELLGYTPQELLGTPTEDLLHDDTERLRLRPVRVLGRTDKGSWKDLVLVWRHADGSPVRLQGSAVILHDRRNRLVGFHGTRRLVEDSTRDREQMLADHARVLDVLETQDVDVALQPIVNLTTGRTVGVEALTRFRDGRPPNVWFADAERCGLSRELDEMTFFQALPLIGALPPTWYMSVNASPELLLSPAFRERVLGCGLELNRLVIEITEHVHVADYNTLKEALIPLRVHGIKFAIDDTGAGYASLNHVLQLSPDIIKLDRTLLTDLENDRARRSLITALALVALEIGASVTGEGVERGDQRETLALLGVDHAQGFLFSPPTVDHRNWQAWRQPWWTPEHATSRHPVFPQPEAPMV
jgi:PAS domain S-box-containing protein